MGWIRTGLNTIARTVLNKLQDNVTVEDYGAVGDGVTDDSTAFQNAINDLPNGGKLKMLAKRYKINSPLVFPSGKYWQTLEGTAFTHGTSGANTFSILDFSGLAASSVGITSGGKTTLKDVNLLGNGLVAGWNSTGFKAINDCELNGVLLMNWGIGADIATSFYSRLNKVSCRLNGLGLQINQCFNMSIRDCYINGGTPAARSAPTGNGILIKGATSQVNIIGGSIEAYWGASGYAVSITSAGTIVNSSGLYTESYADASHLANAAYLVTGGRVVLNISANLGYVYYQPNFVDASGATIFNLTSKANQFFNATAYVANIYALPALGSLFACQIDIAGDSTSNILASVPTYCTPSIAAGSILNCNIAPPTYSLDNTQMRHEYKGRPVVNIISNAVPPAPMKGVIYWASGSGWNPFTSPFTPYPVLYDGSTFRQMVSTSLVTAVIYVNTATRTLTTGQNAVADTSSTAITITLPASPIDGDTHMIKIFNGANACTVNGNGVNIDGAATYVLAASTYQTVSVVYQSFFNKWLITSKI